MIETLIRQLLAGQFNSVECKRFYSVGLGAAVTAERICIFRRRGMDLCKQCLNLSIFRKLPTLLFENQIISHAAGGKFPHAGFIFTAISMGVEMARTFIRLLKQFHQKEKVLDRLRTEAQILIEARTFLIVQVDMK